MPSSTAFMLLDYAVPYILFHNYLLLGELIETARHKIFLFVSCFVHSPHAVFLFKCNCWFHLLFIQIKLSQLNVRGVETEYFFMFLLF